jgi:hypothetical protein
VVFLAYQSPNNDLCLWCVLCEGETVVANATFGAQCVEGLPFFYRASAVAIVGNATVATAVSLSVWNSTLALQALAGVDVPQYDQTSFTSSTAMVLVLDGVQQENVTVAVVASNVTAALLSSYAAFMPVFSLTAGIVVIFEQSLPSSDVAVAVVDCAVWASASFNVVNVVRR